VSIDQSNLNPELFNWLKSRQSALKIVKTTVTPSGQTLDWVPIESQVPTGKIAIPPPFDSMPARTIDARKPVLPASLELDDPRVERGPAGTVPVVRPDISRLTRTVAQKDYLTKRGGLYVNKDRPNRGPINPTSTGYFHVTDSQRTAAVYGSDFFLNVWDPVIDEPVSDGEDHSILQVWLQNYDKPELQSIEGGWTVDKSLNNDDVAHVFTYYTTNGYSKDGDDLGGYNQLHKGWVQYSPSVFPGIRINGISTWGGQQLDISMKFQLYQEPNSNVFNWWVAVQGAWMGYYPATLFNGGLGGKVEWIGIGGEVATDLSNPFQTKDQMGSGWQAQAGWTYAAFIRNVRNQSDLNGTMVNNNGVGTSDEPLGGGTNPYTIQTFINSGSTWGSYLYGGGQTPVAVEQAKFDQITFDIGTGGDDLRGDSSATVRVGLSGGPQTFTLKAQSDPGWGNNSDHVKTFTITKSQTLSEFGPMTITLTSHNSIFETDDNWNIQYVIVTVSGPSGSAVIFSQAGNPLSRLTGSQPSVTLQPGTGGQV
jgi:hypothetical protein